MARYYPNGSNKKRTEKENASNPGSIPEPVRDLSENTSGFFGDWFDFYSGKSSYSDMVARQNERTDGWYSTVYNAVPLVRDIHKALLSRDSAKDYLDTTGLSWKDMQGYNDIKLVGGSSSGLGNIISPGITYLNNIGSDLGKLYSGQKS